MAVSSPRLPLEVILMVIESIVPDPTAVLYRQDPRTLLLLAFTLVSRSTYRTASLLLRRHCAVIADYEDLKIFIQCLDRPTFHPDLPWHAITRLYLRPFNFEETLFEPSVQEAVCDVCYLLARLAPTLRALIFTGPSHFLSNIRSNDADDAAVRNNIRSAFSRLDHVEEFVSNFDDPKMANYWSFFPALRRLVVCTAPVADPILWRNLAAQPRLEFALLIEGYYYAYSSTSELPPLANIKRIYLDALQEEGLTVFVAGENAKYDEDGWEDLDREERMRFRLHYTESGLVYDMVADVMASQSL